MKAITCSQCGALLTDFNKSDEFIKCEYCRAKIPIIKERIIHVQSPSSHGPKSPTYEPFTDGEKANLFKSVDEDDVPFLDYEEKQKFFVIGILVFVLIFVVVLINYRFRSDEAIERDQSVPASVSESN